MIALVVAVEDEDPAIFLLVVPPGRISRSAARAGPKPIDAGVNGEGSVHAIASQVH